MILSITSKGFIFYYCMVLSGIEQYGQNPAFLLVALARNTHRLFVSLPHCCSPTNVFSRVWEFTRSLQFGIWVLHHRMLLHAVICVTVYKVYVAGQGHSTASL